jgi:hypothetical protein
MGGVYGITSRGRREKTDDCAGGNLRTYKLLPVQVKSTGVVEQKLLCTIKNIRKEKFNAENINTTLNRGAPLAWRCQHDEKEEGAHQVCNRFVPGTGFIFFTGLPLPAKE